MPTYKTARFLKVLKKPETIAALVLVIAFFLPWLGNPALSVRGYDISRMLHFFDRLQPVAVTVQVLVYLVPVGAVAILILCFGRPSASSRPLGVLSLLTGMVPVVVLIVLYFRSPYILQQLHPGFLITLAASIVLLITGANR